MASSRVTRLGVSLVLGLVLTVGLASAALGASPTDPTPGPSATPAVAVTPGQTIAPKTPPPNPKTSTTPAGCLPSESSSTLIWLSCLHQSGHSTQPNAGGAAPATTGFSIQGTVTGTAATPVANILVDAFGGGHDYFAVTDGSGNYSVDAVPAGTWTVEFIDESGTYLDGYYDSGAGGHFTISFGSATPVTVTSGNVTGISAQLGTGHFIRGTVTGTGGTPLGNINVDVSTASYSYMAGTRTALDGTYSIDVPDSGSYYVEFLDATTYTYLTGYWDGGTVAVDGFYATPVAVGTTDVTGISVQMLLPWTVTLGASATTVIAGASVTLTATVNQDVGPTPYYIVILTSGGTVVGSGVCGVGTTCATTVTSSVPASATYHAVVGHHDGTLPQMMSTAVTVTWTTFATYHALTPTRILDTRDGTGGLSGAFSSHVARTFTVWGHGGVPTGAIAVTGNLTVTQQSSLGYLAIGPVAQNNPTSSTLNFPVADDRANSVTVALSGTGTLSVTYAAPTLGPTAQVIFDVTGYFTPDMTGATYHALTPTRILDTRDGTGGLSGPFSSHVARTFTVWGHGGVPTGAIAVTGNLTVTQQTSLGYLAVGPVAMNNPTSSTLNFPLGDDRANAVTVALSGTGTLSVTYASPNLAATAQVIFDVTGYFTPDASGAVFVPLTPTRILDSRDGTGGLSGPFSSHVARTFTVIGSGGVPTGTIAVTGNLTVTQQTNLGFLSIGPVAMNNPTSSTLNFPLNDDRANAVTVALGGGGTLSITYAAPVAGKTAHAIFDVTGYFVP
jgi:hypothetical protein